MCDMALGLAPSANTYHIAVGEEDDGGGDGCVDEGPSMQGAENAMVAQAVANAIDRFDRGRLNAHVVQVL
jgi:hypothetical protein